MVKEGEHDNEPDEVACSSHRDAAWKSLQELFFVIVSHRSSKALYPRTMTLLLLRTGPRRNVSCRCSSQSPMA